MTARSTNTKNRAHHADLSKTFVEVENTETIWGSAFTALKMPNNATTANRGRLGAYTGAVGELAMGEYTGQQEPAIGAAFASAPLEEAIGNTGATEPPKASVYVGGRFYSKATVTDVTAITDQGKPVFLTDDDLPTLTAGTRIEPVGWLIKRHADNTADWYFFGPNARMAGMSVERLPLTAAPISLLTGVMDVAGNVLTGYPMPCSGIIVGLGYQPTVASTGAGGAIVNAELDGTNVTAGSVTVGVTAANAVVLYTAAATAGHYFSRGALLDLESDGGVAATGAGAAAHFFVDVIKLPGS